MLLVPLPAVVPGYLVPIPQSNSDTDRCLTQGSMYFQSYFLTSFEYVIVIICDVVLMISTYHHWINIVFSMCEILYLLDDFFAVGQRRWFTLLSTHAAKLPLADVDCCRP